MKILLVDDEKFSLSQMTSLLDRIPGVRIVGFAHSGLEAIKKAADLRPDIVLMDIMMPGCNGLLAARNIANMHAAPAIIFVSASQAHALEAFDLHADGYLLKPVQFERLRDALITVGHRRSKSPQLQVAETSAKYVYCRAGTGVRLVAMRQVPYLRACNKYTELVCRGERLFSSQSLTHFERRFTSVLVRLRRDVLANRDYIKGINRLGREHYEVILKGIKKPIRVSRRNQTQIRRAITDHAPDKNIIARVNEC